eukprot:626323-Hanusia_phi.AAC.2
MVGVSQDLGDVKAGAAAHGGWMFSVASSLCPSQLFLTTCPPQVGDGSVWHLDEEVFSSSEQGDISNLVPSSGLFASLIRSPTSTRPSTPPAPSPSSCLVPDQNLTELQVP